MNMRSFTPRMTKTVISRILVRWNQMGALKMFKRSEGKYDLRYTTFIGDGDSSSYSTVVAAKPYGDDVVINKGECIGHVQKRVGTRLRNLKKIYKEVLSDGKKLGGAGRLTEGYQHVTKLLRNGNQTERWWFIRYEEMSSRCSFSLLRINWRWNTSSILFAYRRFMV